MPTCAPYCEGPHHGADEWDVRIATGEMVRSHSGGGWPPMLIRVGADRHRYAEVGVGAHEHIGGTLEPTTVTVPVHDLDMTPEQARTYARYMLEAADVAAAANRMSV